MIVNNLTDLAKRGEPSPHDVKVGSTVIRPGKRAEVGNVPLAKLSGMIYKGKISVGERPDWYIRAKRKTKRRVSVAEVPAEPPKVETWLEQEDTE